jgi:hypothetical protein
VALVAGVIGCGDGSRLPADSVASRLDRARVTLAASFVGGRAAGLRDRLHDDVIVQPPEPDTSRQGTGAADYLERLARETEVRHSELLPARITEEGGFLLEQGTWLLETERFYRSRYTIRWRDSDGGWQVVLLRWTRFQ